MEDILKEKNSTTFDCEESLFLTEDFSYFGPQSTPSDRYQIDAKPRAATGSRPSSQSANEAAIISKAVDPIGTEKSPANFAGSVALFVFERFFFSALVFRIFTKG